MKSQMKNLRVFFILASLVLLLGSCDKIKDLLTITIPTTIEGEIPLRATKSSSNITKALVVNFSRSQGISVADNPELVRYVNKIKDIDIESIQIQFKGLTSGQVIDFITIDIEGVGNIATLQNITANSLHSPNISKELLNSVSQKLLKNLIITVNVSGRANSEINAAAVLKMKAEIKAQALN